MTRLFDELFESAGYDETGWGETVDAGCTLDEDTAVVAAGTPNGWSDQCLLANVVGATGTNAYANIDLAAVADEADTWIRFEFVVTNNGLDTNGNDVTIFNTKDSFDTILYVVNLRNDSGTLKLRMRVKLDGTTNIDYLSDEIVLNTRYRVEVQWKTSTDEFSWMINGVMQDKVSLEVGHGIGLDKIYRLGLNGVTATKDMTVYFDNVAIDDTEWVGPELTLPSWTRSNYTDTSQVNEVDPDEGHGGIADTGKAVNIFTSDGTATSIRQTSILTVGKRYQAEIDQKVNNDGALHLGSASDTDYIAASWGTVADNQTFDFIAQYTDFQITSVGNDVDATIDNIRIVELNVAKVNLFGGHGQKGREVQPALYLGSVTFVFGTMQANNDPTNPKLRALVDHFYAVGFDALAQGSVADIKIGGDIDDGRTMIAIIRWTGESWIYAEIESLTAGLEVSIIGTWVNETKPEDLAAHV